MSLDRMWHRQAFRIARLTDTTYVDGIVLGAATTPMFGLHVSAAHTIDVTHLPSGKRIGACPTLGMAMEFAHRLAPLRDWSSATLALTEREMQQVRDMYTIVLKPSTQDLAPQ